MITYYCVVGSSNSRWDKTWQALSQAFRLMSLPGTNTWTNFTMLCTYPAILSFVHECIYFWFPLWLFLEQDSLLWNIVLEVSGPFYSLITRNYATNFNMNFLEVSLLL